MSEGEAPPRSPGYLTPRAARSRARNWKIKRLRGMWAQARDLPPGSVIIVRQEIDKALIAMGAESQTAKIIREWADSDRDHPTP